MINDEIIRSFANLHPDTPIDGKLFAVPLRVIKRMLETAAAAEREWCAKLCEKEMVDEIEDEAYYICKDLALRIRKREEA